MSKNLFVAKCCICGDQQLYVEQAKKQHCWPQLVFLWLDITVEQWFVFLISSWLSSVLTNQSPHESDSWMLYCLVQYQFLLIELVSTDCGCNYGRHMWLCLFPLIIVLMIIIIPLRFFFRFSILDCASSKQRSKELKKIEASSSILSFFSTENLIINVNKQGNPESVRTQNHSAHYYHVSIVHCWMHIRPCLVHPKIQKLFKISHHIESCGICMEH